MLVLRKLFSKTKKEKEDVDTSLLKGGAALAGAAGLAGITTADEVTGKVTRYHNTLNENVDKILEEGIKSKYAEDPNNLTNKYLHDVDMEKKKGKVYLAKDKTTANSVGVRRSNPTGIISPMDNVLRRHPGNKNLKLEFEYDDLKDNFKEVDNPEFRGLKKNDYKGLYEKINPGRKWKDLSYVEKLNFKESMKQLSTGTQVIEGDIDSKYIVGGKNYKKRGIKEFGRYIKNHPGRFAKGVVKIGTAAALVGYGIKKGIDSYKGEKEFSESSEDLLSPEEEKILNNYKYVLGAPYVQAMLDNTDKEYKETDEEFKNRYEDYRKSGIKRAAIISPIAAGIGHHLSGKKGAIVNAITVPTSILGINALGRKRLVKRREEVKKTLSSPEKMKELEKDKDLAKVFLGELSKKEYKSRWYKNKEKKEEK